MSEKIFALDIGTRSVVGIILEQTANGYHVVDLISEEHKERAMVDGQIHNVIYVANVIASIKTQLEAKHGPLRKVSVAAAGRSLKTEQASATMAIKNRPAMTATDIDRLELAAVQEAQAKLLAHKENVSNSHYYCVGYSVLFYHLDGEEIGSLIDQQGNEAVIDVIATFLPRVVVESLIAALKRAGLEMDGLTLEPIAAINALIPPSMRRLNVALVDIGAGTSDIAITDKSTVTAYGMVPTAGDEITEALSDHYLLDFPVAEKMKRELSLQEHITIADILGFEQDIPTAEVIQTIRPTIQFLASSIAEEIKRLNSQQSPKAVLLIGGGSLTPSITEMLSEALDLPAQRVAVRDIDAIQGLTRDPAVPATPELVTPIGIAIAANNTPIKYMSITVNDQTIRLFELKEMAVTDALLAANIVASKLYGKPGLAMTVSLNGQSIHIPGELGSPTQIMINGAVASMKSTIQNGDVITLIEGLDGQAGSATVADLLDAAAAKTLAINGELQTIQLPILVNGVASAPTTALQEGDALTFVENMTIADALKHSHLDYVLADVEEPFFFINDKKLPFSNFSSKLTLNGVSVTADQIVKDGDEIEYTAFKSPSIAELSTTLHMDLLERCEVFFQQEKIHLTKPSFKLFVNKEAATAETLLHSGDRIQFIKIDNAPWTYQDIFKYTKWTLPSDFKGTFDLLKNGENVPFDAPIFGGDQLEIKLNTSASK